MHNLFSTTKEFKSHYKTLQLTPCDSKSQLSSCMSKHIFFYWPKFYDNKRHGPYMYRTGRSL